MRGLRLYHLVLLMCVMNALIEWLIDYHNRDSIILYDMLRGLVITLLASLAQLQMR